MNEPLPPFSGDTPTCTKCRYQGASTQYRELGRCIHGDAISVIGIQKNERLHRECLRCGHAWDEALAQETP
jgi:predicted nucleic-acid-binding Zn-ribbon protein